MIRVEQTAVHHTQPGTQNGHCITQDSVGKPFEILSSSLFTELVYSK